MTDFKPGDRVRVTYEATVNKAQTSNVYLAVRTDNQHYTPFLNDPAVLIEKIVEPEPEWAHGDVVKTPDSYPFIYDDSTGWRGAKGNSAPSFEDAVSDAWESGTLTILHRRDA